PVPAPTAHIVSTGHPYQTRLVVRRPKHERDFNGTVVVEWTNVTSGYDVEALWFRTHEFLMRSGYAWVGVSAQNAGILRGDTNPGVARAHEEFMRPEPERFDVIAAGDVGPFDDHRTVEIALVLGTANDKSRLVRMPGADDMGGRRRNG